MKDWSGQWRTGKRQSLCSYTYDRHKCQLFLLLGFTIENLYSPDWSVIAKSLTKKQRHGWQQLCYRCRHLAKSTKRNVVFDSPPLVPLCEKMTSSRKPDEHSMLHCRQRMTEPRSKLTYTENFVKFGHVVFEICERTDWLRNADRNISQLCRRRSEYAEFILYNMCTECTAKYNVINVYNDYIIYQCNVAGCYNL